MSTVAIVVIAIGAVLALLFAVGLLAARRRASHPEVAERIRAADRALEQARASDRGWDRERMSAACGQAIRDQRPDFEWETIELVLVDDRPGVTEDRAHLVASGAQGSVRVVLARREGGEWFAQEVS
jgi:type II secretory pathway pseudopilin PulG